MKMSLKTLQPLKMLQPNLTLERQVIKMGEIAVATLPGEIICYGLGSCVGVFLYDKFKKVGAGAHIMLPGNMMRPESDRMLDKIIKDLYALGARQLTLRARLVGGADIMNIDAYNIGNRNVDYVRQKMKEEGIMIQKEDVGGKESRTAKLNIETGALLITTSEKKKYTI